MKRLMLVLALSLSTVAHASNADWADKLERYRQGLKTTTDLNLWVNNTFFTSAALATCSMSAAVVGAAFIADTTPVTNLVAETIANSTVPDYQSYESLLSWESLAQLGRGLIGGGPIAMVESLQFVVLWLGGNQDQSFEQAKKVYSSTFKTAESVFANESQCMMSLSRVLLVRREMQARKILPGGQFPPAQTPDQPPVQTPAKP